jgi:hypothetical protein
LCPQNVKIMFNVLYRLITIDFSNLPIFDSTPLAVST